MEIQIIAKQAVVLEEEKLVCVLKGWVLKKTDYKIDEVLEYFCSHESYDLTAKVKRKVNKVMYLYHLIWWKLHIKNRHFITYFLNYLYLNFLNIKSIFTVLNFFSCKVLIKLTFTSMTV